MAARKKAAPAPVDRAGRLPLVTRSSAGAVMLRSPGPVFDWPEGGETVLIPPEDADAVLNVLNVEGQDPVASVEWVLPEEAPGRVTPPPAAPFPTVDTPDMPTVGEPAVAVPLAVVDTTPTGDGDAGVLEPDPLPVVDTTPTEPDPAPAASDALPTVETDPVVES